MKVYGWGYGTRQEAVGSNRQTREIVAARSVRAAWLAFQNHGHPNATYSNVARFGGWTGNEQEIEVATRKPGTVFWHSLNEFGDRRVWHESKKTKPEKQHRAPCELLAATDSALLAGLDCSCPKKARPNAPARSASRLRGRPS